MNPIKVTTRYYGATYIASAGGKRASNTSWEQGAVDALARKLIPGDSRFSCVRPCLATGGKGEWKIEAAETVTFTFTTVAQGLPDDDTTVLVRYSHGEDILYTGAFRHSGQWWNLHEQPLEHFGENHREVLAWAPLP
ncbi:MAG TPA: hypothetical protein VMF06_20140 [Candidatus Limnocylindria bacterium]|jgi:hypothetical protein|nr:hypothetical protein [Candidatus Limnocylindria bacterium]